MHQGYEKLGFFLIYFLFVILYTLKSIIVHRNSYSMFKIELLGLETGYALSSK